MDDRPPDATLEAGLGGLDWRRGLTGADVAARLPSGDPLAGLLRQHLPDGPYFSPQDLLHALPPPARDEARALPWRGGATAGSALAAEPTVPGAGSPLAAGGPDPGAVGTTDALRLDPAAPPLAWAAEAEERANAGAESGTTRMSSLPERVRQTATQAWDQVLGIRMRPANAPTVDANDRTTDRWRAPAFLSAAVDRLDRAVGDRSGKAGSFATLGLTLALILGLDSLRGQRAPGANGAAGSVDRLRGLLLVAWAVAFAVNAWDLRQTTAASGTDAAGGAGRREAEPASPGTSAAGANAATDEYPTVGSR